MRPSRHDADATSVEAKLTAGGGGGSSHHAWAREARGRGGDARGESAGRSRGRRRRGSRERVYSDGEGGKQRPRISRTRSGTPLFNRAGRGGDRAADEKVGDGALEPLGSRAIFPASPASSGRYRRRHYPGGGATNEHRRRSLSVGSRSRRSASSCPSPVEKAALAAWMADRIAMRHHGGGGDGRGSSRAAMKRHYLRGGRRHSFESPHSIFSPSSSMSGGSLSYRRLAPVERSRSLPLPNSPDSTSRSGHAGQAASGRCPPVADDRDANEHGEKKR